MYLKLIVIAMLALAGIAGAQAPQMIHYQGRITVSGTNLTGTGQFKFALVNSDGGITYWSSGDSTVAIPVTKGLYSVLLGDTGMNPIPASVFTHGDVRLRVWFDDGTHGLLLLSPDSRIASVGFAMMAANVPDGSITGDKLASGAVGTEQLASGLANGIVPWQVSAANTPTVASNTGYLLTSDQLSDLLLPLDARIGDLVRVSGAGSGGWQFSPNIGQSINGYTAATSIGQNWTPVANSSDAWYGLALDDDGSTILAVGSYGGRVWVSHDYGSNWTAWGGGGYWDGATAAADGMKLAVKGTTVYGSNRTIHTSSDGGATWVARDNIGPWGSIACSADGSRLAVTDHGGQIHISEDWGQTWTARAENRNWWHSCLSADGSRMAATASNAQIYTSADGGLTWTARESARTWTQIACSADGRKLVAGVANGNLYISNDYGVTWVPRGETANWQYLSCSADGTRMLANDHAQSGRIFLSTDGGETWNQVESNRYWRQTAVSGDGRTIAAAVDRGYIYVSRAEMTGTTVAGGQGTTATLQYLGNGVWQPMNEALIGNGTIGSIQLQAGAVGTTQIAGGAITADQIAGGAVGATQLAKPPRSGSIASTDLSIMFNCATTSVAFPTAFNTTPVVTLSLDTESPAVWDQSSLVVSNRSTTGFTAKWRNSSLPMTLDSDGDVGWESSLAYIGRSGMLRPTISYRDRTNGDLKVIRAMDPNGSVWNAPVSVTTTGNVGAYSSLLWLPGYNVPAISYYDYDNYDLKFIRANDADGRYWRTPVTVDALNDVGAFHSTIRLSNSNPAIAYYDSNYGDLKFARANAPDGGSWATPVYVDTTATTFVSAPVSAAVVNSYPAILYRNSNNNDLLYVRANDTTGSSWGTPNTVASGASTAAASMAVVNGHPAFCYSAGGALHFLRASDASGTAWGSPVTLDNVTVSGARNLQFAVIGGKPAVSYYTNGDLRYAFASDADGSTWNPPVTVDMVGNTGQYNSLAEVNGAPGISYYDATACDLRFVRHAAPDAFTINWIALEP